MTQTKSLQEYAKISSEDSFAKIDSSKSGLTDQEAQKRMEKYGKNVIATTQRQSMLKTFLTNFTSMMAILLWIAGFIALLTGTPELGIAIWLVNIINGVFSFWQQYRAQQATSALQKLLPSYVKVVRNGQSNKILASELVPGDIVTLNSGDNIPADGRLLTADSLEVNQSSLTGESTTVNKEIDIQTEEALKRAGKYAEANLVYEGTSVVNGSGVFVVLATGMATEFGQIASLTTSVTDVKSPLQKELDILTRQLSMIAIVIGILFFIAAVFFVGYPWAKAFIFALGMVVAFIPEGLLPTVTLSLAMAVQKMAKKNALVKHLNSVETLGETTVICSDKTGTLTKNEMTIEKVWLPNANYTVSGTGYEPNGIVKKGAKRIDLSQEKDLLQLLRIGSLCNDSAIEEKNDYYQLVGSPDEGSILILAAKADYDLIDEQKDYPRKSELPFDSKHKRMSTIHTHDNQQYVFTKGGITEVLSCCQNYLKNGQIAPLDDTLKKQILTQNDSFAKDGLRTLAFAYRPLKSNEELTIENCEQNLIFVGITASQDPPRENVMDAIQKCHDAAIRIIMVTGDYGLTAESIARKIGIVKSDDVRVITGDDLAAMSEATLKENLRHEIIFARVAPEQKYRVVSTLQSLGEVVASTGDGVNDAPALKKADIGVAMGITGTDVAKEAADMILTDDNFTSIVNAIEEGRTVYNNIRKFLLYILNSNMPEAIPSLLFLISKGTIPLPLTVMQILTIDLGTDMLPALGLATEQTEAGTMKKPPRKQSEHLLTKQIILKAFAWYGLLASLISIGAYLFVNHLNGWPSVALASNGKVYAMATTMTLAAIVFCQIGAVFNCRTEKQSLFQIGLFSNKRILGGIIFEVILITCLMYLPFLQKLFGTRASNCKIGYF
ncbi:potassium/sodium efflux P-type ATPase, fungal-type [Enterococcus dispar ATCC 51266]|uniref:Potassium/sodium efflux P-type ATPase, fungal-type n=2 Tax=Enterococcus TaxID=1350 RepID=S0K880_9ENTE|nr:potassium/sodium efflux P-type ATPase, fungal-type [Enterococcus dispar ATCC 51266]EOW86800.1 potassium/sodium efflux P-type ATPase, fungal-type [Enterococcus dispar ATCC 51266]OJG39744.1 potassium/sodium efflux P-type ATPase, fungal-type [Enterococcus dispar]